MEETLATEVIEMVGTTDTALMEQLLGTAQNIEYVLNLLAGFGLFFVVVLLCYFSYKFFRIFF